MPKGSPDQSRQTQRTLPFDGLHVKLIRDLNYACKIHSPIAYLTTEVTSIITRILSPNEGRG